MFNYWRFRRVASLNLFLLDCVTQLQNYNFWRVQFDFVIRHLPAATSLVPVNGNFTFCKSVKNCRLVSTLTSLSSTSSRIADQTTQIEEKIRSTATSKTTKATLKTTALKGVPAVGGVSRKLNLNCSFERKKYAQNI